MWKHKKQKKGAGSFQFSVSKCGTFIVGLCILESQVKNYVVIFTLLSNFLLRVFEWAQEKENLFPPLPGIFPPLPPILGDKAHTWFYNI